MLYYNKQRGRNSRKRKGRMGATKFPSQRLLHTAQRLQKRPCPHQRREELSQLLFPLVNRPISSHKLCVLKGSGRRLPSMSNSIHFLCHLRLFTINTSALGLEAADCPDKRAASREFRDNGGKPRFLHSHCGARRRRQEHRCTTASPQSLRNPGRKAGHFQSFLPPPELLDFILINHRPLLWFFPQTKFL